MGTGGGCGASGDRQKLDMNDGNDIIDNVTSVDSVNLNSDVREGLIVPNNEICPV